MDRHRGHRKDPDHRNHRETTNLPILSNNPRIQLRKTATIRLTTIRDTTIMADTEETATTVPTTITRDTAETTTTTIAEDRTRRIISNPQIPRAECTG